MRIEAYVVTVDGKYIEANSARDTQVVGYQLFATNNDPTTLPAEITSIVGPVPETSTYIPGSASESDDFALEYSSDSVTFSATLVDEVGAVRWTYLKPFEPGEEIKMSYRVVIGDELPTEEHADFSGFASTGDSDSSGSGSAQAFTQSMFGHLGIIEILCPEKITRTSTGGVEAVCGRSTDGFDLFKQKWDLYADYESEVPIVPEPVSAWRLVDDMFTREYYLDNKAYSITYFDNGDSNSRLVFALY